MKKIQFKIIVFCVVILCSFFNANAKISGLYIGGLLGMNSGSLSMKQTAYLVENGIGKTNSWDSKNYYGFKDQDNVFSGLKVGLLHRISRSYISPVFGIEGEFYFNNNMSFSRGASETYIGRTLYENVGGQSFILAEKVSLDQKMSFIGKAGIAFGEDFAFYVAVGSTQASATYLLGTEADINTPSRKAYSKTAYGLYTGVGAVLSMGENFSIMADVYKVNFNIKKSNVLDSDTDKMSVVQKNDIIGAKLSFNIIL